MAYVLAAIFGVVIVNLHAHEEAEPGQPSSVAAVTAHALAVTRPAVRSITFSLCWLAFWSIFADVFDLIDHVDPSRERLVNQPRPSSTTSDRLRSW